MGDHLDTILIKPTDEDVRVGVTDLYAFQKPGEMNKSTLILDCAPFVPAPSPGFHPDAIYQINVDADADVVTDIAFNVTFTPLEAGRQVATVRRATGSRARSQEAEGEILIEGAPVSSDAEALITDSEPYRFFAGMRSDPFFADFEGLQNNFQFTGSDYFAGKNVLAIALEVPNADLGPNPQVALWARTSIRRDGTIVQVDRIGSPGINIGFNEGEDMAAHNGLEPSGDRARFFDSFVATLQHRSGYSAEEATGIAEQLLPDLLRYDYSAPAAFPNGRTPTDDVVDPALALLTRGQLTTDMVGPHNDLLTEFPYLGPPN